MRRIPWRVAAVFSLAAGLVGLPAAPAMAGNLQPPVTLSLTRSAQTVQPSAQFTVTVHLDMPSTTATKLSPHLIDYIGMEIHFDPSVLHATDFEPIYPFTVLAGPSINNTAGTAALEESVGDNPTNALQGAADVATLTFQATSGDHAVSPINWLHAAALSLSSNDQAAENVVGVAYGATVCVDSALPACRKLPPAARIPLTRLGTDGVKVRLAWGATDGDGVSGYQLQQSTNGAAFSTVTLPSPTATSATRLLTAGDSYQFQVQYTDGLGNTSGYAIGPGFEVDNNGNSINEAFLVKLYDDTATATYSSGWTSAALSGAYGGSVHDASGAGDTATFAVRNTSVAQSSGVSQAQSIAWVSTKGPDRGEAQVWLDGRKVATVNLYAPTQQTREVVFSKNVNPSRSHVLKIVVLGASDPASTGARVDVDAFVVLH